LEPLVTDDDTVEDVLYRIALGLDVEPLFEVVVLDVDVPCELPAPSFTLAHDVDGGVEQFCEAVASVTLSVVRYPGCLVAGCHRKISARTPTQLGHFTDLGVGVENTLHIVLHVAAEAADREPRSSPKFDHTGLARL